MLILVYFLCVSIFTISSPFLPPSLPFSFFFILIFLSSYCRDNLTLWSKYKVVMALYQPTWRERGKENMRTKTKEEIRLGVFCLFVFLRTETNLLKKKRSILGDMIGKETKRKERGRTLKDLKSRLCNLAFQQDLKSVSDVQDSLP